MKKLTSALLLSLVSVMAYSQVVWLDPLFASQNDNVTVYYDASEGNAALVGQTQIYAHTGVITNLSNSPTDWRHVQGNWGTADPQVEMTQVAGPIFKITYNIDQFYNVPANETVTHLAFVFRNASGNVVGRDEDGGDIFVPIYSGGFAAAILSPTSSGIVDPMDNINFEVACSEPANISLYHNSTLLKTASTDTITDTSFVANAFGPGKHFLWYDINYQGTFYRDSVSYIINEPVVVQDPPAGIEDGVNVINNTTVILQLTAPFKDFVYAVGDFSNWELDPMYMMKQNTAGDRWWVQIDNLDPNAQYRYQFHVGDEGLRIADVYAEMQLDPFNDQFIPSAVYPNIPDYPTGLTENYVSVFQINENEYTWDNTINYQRPAQEELVIYELLVRDFLHSHSYQGLIDSLDYLTNLGVNAIELMPINEFEGNISWGYNPSFFFAPDKYYGSKDDLKMFIEECHRRDIAVLLDVALNHSFGQNPQVMMYFNPNAGPWGQPTAESPWFNEVPKHDFNVGYDYNHESPYTKEFTKRAIAHWVEEYRIDGYRFDLSKGFTQRNTLGNIGAWNAYDQSRVDILTEYANHLWAIDSDLILTLEHLGDNPEEQALSDIGFMLWGNIHGQYKEASLGYTSNLSSVSHKNRGWNDPHLIGYYTSHDEQRLVFENENYGNSSGNYNIKNPQTAIERMELVNVFLLGVPGPKMIWQFDELGYDFPINYCENGTINPDCRTAPKPIRWDYIQDANRIRVYNTVAAMNRLRNNYPVFHSNDFNLAVGGMQKRIQLNSANHHVTILGNFSVNAGDINPNFQKTGWWYEYFSGDSINVTNVNQNINLQPGEYRLYSDIKLETPDLNAEIRFDTTQGPNTSIKEVGVPTENIQLFPNPAGDHVVINSDLPLEDAQFTLFNINGGVVRNHRIFFNGAQSTVALNGLPAGVYFYQIQTETGRYNGRLIKSNTP